jgi:hypothetical protein
VPTTSQQSFELDEQRENGVIVIDQTVVSLPLKKQAVVGATMLDAKISALVKVLSAYGLLDGMSIERVQSLIRDISVVFEGE